MPSEATLLKKKNRAKLWYHRNKWRTRPGALHCGLGMRGKVVLYDKDEALALRAFRHFDRAWARAHQVAISKLNCKKCGNDRVVNPDKDGRCCVCLAARRISKRKRRVSRQRSNGSWVHFHRVSKQARRARILNAPGSGVGIAAWRHVLALYGSKCLKCGASPVGMDHVQPLALGGAHDPSNIQPLCHLCNSRKSASSCADYRPFPYREVV